MLNDQHRKNKLTTEKYQIINLCLEVQSMNTPEEKQLTTTQRLNTLMENDKVKQMFENALGNNANVFVASMVELVANDTALQGCEPRLIMQECLKAAVLNLPINKNLGFAWVIPYSKSIKVGNNWEKVKLPQFQLGKNGIVQLALRTGKYKTIHEGCVYEGQIVDQNFLTGELKITGEPTSDNPIGFFAYFELTNGFKKALFWTKERITAHAKKYSKSFGYDNSPWQTEFPEMAKGTLLKRLLKKYGILSTEMSTAFTGESHETLSPSGQLEKDVTDNANQGDVIDITDVQQPENPLEEQPPVVEPVGVDARPQF